ncbi:MAG: hypothetical protein ACPIOQ_10915 [Promethearchaeia archaeon]
MNPRSHERCVGLVNKLLECSNALDRERLEARASEERSRAAVGNKEQEAARDLHRVNLAASREAPGKFWR